MKRHPCIALLARPRDLIRMGINAGDRRGPGLGRNPPTKPAGAAAQIQQASSFQFKRLLQRNQFIGKCPNFRQGFASNILRARATTGASIIRPSSLTAPSAPPAPAAFTTRRAQSSSCAVGAKP